MKRSTILFVIGAVTVVYANLTSTSFLSTHTSLDEILGGMIIVWSRIEYLIEGK